MSRVEKMKGGEDGGQRKRNAPSPYMRGNAPIIKDTYVHHPPPLFPSSTTTNSFSSCPSDRVLIAVQPAVNLVARTQQIGDTLGKGAFGTVFRGLNIKTGEVVAIKQIEKKLIREDQMPQIMVYLHILRQPFFVNIYFCILLLNMFVILLFICLLYLFSYI